MFLQSHSRTCQGRECVFLYQWPGNLANKSRLPAAYSEEWNGQEESSKWNERNWIEWKRIVFEYFRFWLAWKQSQLEPKIGLLSFVVGLSLFEMTDHLAPFSGNISFEGKTEVKLPDCPISRFHFFWFICFGWSESWTSLLERDRLLLFLFFCQLSYDTIYLFVWFYVHAVLRSAIGFTVW